MGSTREDIEAAYADLDAAWAAVAALSYDALTVTEKRDLLVRLETNRRRGPAAEHRLINQLAAECAPEVLGGTSLADVLATALRVSTSEARRRIAEADDLGPRTAASGEPLQPRLPTTAWAQAKGTIGAEHINTIRTFFHKLPNAGDHATANRPRFSWPRWPPGWDPPNSTRPPPGWPSCSIRTDPLRPTPTGPARPT